MHVRHLSLRDYRSYEHVELALHPGVTTLVGRNGRGKTNLVEAIGYVASLSSHRVATDAPLVRAGAGQAVIRLAVVRADPASDAGTRESLVELELNPGRANRARLNRAALTRPRDVLGTLRTVLFAPEDLALVKGDPAGRRRFLDDLLVARQPRWAGVRADYERVLRQRNALLRSAAPALRSANRGARRRQIAPHAPAAGRDEASETADARHTLGVWNEQLTGLGAQLLYARLRLLTDLRPHLVDAYAAVSDADAPAGIAYASSLPDDLAVELGEPTCAQEVPEPETLRQMLLQACQVRERDETERGVTLVGPHRDDLVLSLGDLPAKGYASHGESWSIALGLKLAAFRLLRTDLADDPVLILDDVFAELDSGRRRRLADLVADSEQVLITAAVAEDIPDDLHGQRYVVTPGRVEPV